MDTFFNRLECNYLTKPCNVALDEIVLSWQGENGRVKIFDESKNLVYDSMKFVASPFRPNWQAQSQKVYYWTIENDKTQVSSSFETAYKDDFDWSPAFWICNHYNQDKIQANSTVFTQTFTYPKATVNSRARLYIGALGIYLIKINGKEISSQVLAPGALNFAKRTIYQVYAIEEFLNEGENTISIELSSGWHSGAIVRTGDSYESRYFGTLDSIIVRLEYFPNKNSNPELLLCSNSSWQTAHKNLRESDIYMGEFFDGRIDNLEYDPAVSEIDLNVALDARNGVPVKRIMELEPIAKQEFDSYTIVDFGQNFTGREKITFTAPRGTIIKIRHGEMLNDDGSLYTANLRKAKAQTTIVAPGGTFTYEPEMTFYGFRYVEVSGVKDFTVKGIVLHSDMLITSNFHCSNELLNKFVQNVQWGQRSNFLDIPTDCPQRDERQGWLGDAQIFAPVALFNMHSAAFFRKWLVDVRSCCSKDGRYPNVAPSYPYGNLKFSSGTSGWADAGIIIPYLLYLYYGDKGFLQENSSAIYKWVNYQAKNSQDGLCCHARFKDWLNINSPTSEEFISTAYFTYGAKLAQKIAEVLGDKAAEREMADCVQLGQNAIKKHFISNNVLTEQSQCALAMALEFDLLDENSKTIAANLLANDVVSRNYHLTTGFLGTPLLLDALSHNGYIDIAYKLMEQTSCPSWLYPVTQGATTIWERWDSWNEKTGFGDVGMNSFNHYAYGAAANWLYTTCAGIKPIWEKPGFKEFILAPRVGGTLTNLRMTYDSPRGKIVSAWEVSGKEVIYDFTVPIGTKAIVNLLGKEEKVYLPGSYQVVGKKI